MHYVCDDLDLFSLSPKRNKQSPLQAQGDCNNVFFMNSTPSQILYVFEEHND